MPSPLSQPEAWNNVAAAYADDLVPIFTRYAEDALRLARLPSHAHIIDVAAGPGTLSLLAARDVEHVVAVDFAEEMIEMLDRRAALDGITNLEAVKADGQLLPFEDGRFDGYFSMFGLIFFPDRAVGFREAYRVLKPGGRAVVSSWAPLDGVPLLRSCFGALRDLIPWLPFGESKAPLGDEGEFRGEMEEAGFGSVAIHTVEHRLEVPSVTAFWITNERSSAPIALLRKKLSPVEWEDVRAGVMRSLEREFGTGPLEMSWPARLGVGVREP